MENNRVILVVEDNMLERQLLVDILKEIGCVAVFASTRDEAIAAMSARKIDGLIVDLKLVGTNGSTLIAAIRASGNTVPILVLSGQPDPEVLSNAVLLGADAVMLKPFRVADLEKTFEDLGWKKPIGAG